MIAEAKLALGGEVVYSRDEWDAGGAADAKVVEETFVTSGVVWHLHVEGQVIRASVSHPLFVVGRGWVECHDLTIGDRLLCADGTTCSTPARPRPCTTSASPTTRERPPNRCLPSFGNLEGLPSIPSFPRFHSELSPIAHDDLDAVRSDPDEVTKVT